MMRVLLRRRTLIGPIWFDDEHEHDSTNTGRQQNEQNASFFLTRTLNERLLAFGRFEAYLNPEKGLPSFINKLARQSVLDED